ncbi:MAG: PKD domain-containing protein [Flavobacteriales bacterium]|nr:PKD domain-containing protein [Flavobacteriales bacterium]
MPVVASATHIGGGEIYWNCLGNGQYEITLVVYRDCIGIELDPAYDLDVTSPCGDMTVHVTTPGGVELSQLCDQELPNSTCNGGTLPGIQQYIYTGTITLPPCDSWTISWTEIYRNNAIVNLQNPGQQEVYVQATLNNAIAPCDDSPQFTNIAIPYVCTGYPISYSYGAYDPEGDSLSYELISACVGGATPIPYVAPYTPTQPIPGLTLDPVTGLVSFNLNVSGNWVVVVQVNVYDDQGNLIGTIMRDMQFIAYPCSNDPPDPTTGTVANMSGDATQTGAYAVDVCESGDFCFDMVISDPNPGNVLTATTNVQQNLPGATFSYTGTNPITCTVCWSAQPGSSGFFPFIVTVSDGACPIQAFQTYVYQVHVRPGLFIDATAVDESCLGAGDGSASVNVLAGTPPYQITWSTGATGTSIQAGSGTYAVTMIDANACGPTTDTVTIGASSVPGVANAGPDLVGCLNSFPLDLQGIVANAPSGIWSGGQGTLSGNGLNVQYSPSTSEIIAGGVDLVLTTTGNGTCAPDADTVHIALSDALMNAAISATDALCSGSATGTASFTPNDPTLTYLWNDASAQTSATATNLVPGNYSVQVTDVLGCDTTLTVALSAPATLAIAQVNVVDEPCAGTANGSVTVTAAGGTPPYQYTWSNGMTGPTITVGAGTYSVSVTDAHGCTPATATATVTAAAQPPTANAGPDLIGCMDALPVVLQGLVSNAPNGTWSGGTGTFTGNGLNVQYLPSNAEIAAGQAVLTLTATGAMGCPPASDQVVVQLPNSFQNALVQSTPVVCAGAANGTATFSPQNAGFSYAWNDPAGQTTPTATGLPAGNYAVQVTDAFGCGTSLPVTVTEPPVMQLNGPTATNPTCAGSTNGSATVTASGGTPGYSYQWSANSGGQTLPTATALAVGTYVVVVTDANGCMVQGSTTLNAPPPVTLSAQVPATVCVNTPVQLTAQAGGGQGSYTIQWNGIGYGSPITYSFPSPQTVTVSVTDAAGCSGPTLMFPVDVLDLSLGTLQTYGDTVVCPGGSAMIGGEVSNYAGNVQLYWPGLGVNGNGPIIVPVTGDQTYAVVATDACGNTLNGEVHVELDTPPEVVLPPVIAEGCAPLDVDFPENIVNGSFSYLWDFGDGQTSSGMAPTHTYGPGTFLVSLTITTPNGCSSTSAQPGQVLAYAPPTADFDADPWSTDTDNPAVEFTNASTGNIIDNSWSFGDGATSHDINPTYTFQSAGIFAVQLTVEDIHGCTSSVQHSVTIAPVYDVVIPTGFTPNPHGGNGGNYDPSDLSNDVFYPFVDDLKDFDLRIYNRWGELVFESKDVHVGWDGYYRGQLSPQDVYMVQLWVKFVDDRELTRYSDLTLFR